MFIKTPPERLDGIGNQYQDEKHEVVLLQSYLNIFKVRQITLGSSDKSILSFNVPVKAVEDQDILQKVITFNFITFVN